jgi:hypothetical protein
MSSARELIEGVRAGYEPRKVLEAAKADRIIARREEVKDALAKAGLGWISRALTPT